MERERLAQLLRAVQRGECPVEEALDRLRSMPYEDLGFAKLDHHRALRNGFPEVVLGEGKSPEQVFAIAERMAAAGSNVLVTRLAAEVGEELVARLPGFEYHATPRLAVRRARVVEPGGRGTVLVVSAGTADVPVAEEAAISAEVMGNPVERLYDVGVAGLHRLLERRERLWKAAVLIVVAGMEGALPSVVGGLVLVVSAGTADIPVAEEAAVSAELMGNPVDRLYDVGVAGIHRLLERRDRLWQAAILIVVAGMEGALPSVVGGLVDRPVIAVPTSVGYGTSLRGLAALLGMLNTCAAGVVVVNIDNGFGAAAAAARINRRDT